MGQLTTFTFYLILPPERTKDFAIILFCLRHRQQKMWLTSSERKRERKRERERERKKERERERERGGGGERELVRGKVARSPARPVMPRGYLKNRSHAAYKTDIASRALGRCRLSVRPSVCQSVQLGLGCARGEPSAIEQC
jgi:hypothetical protein